jgi:DNA-binding GntR family transcriptional regulator
MTLEPSSPLPLYHQLERVLAERIADGRYRDGFPGDLELAAEFSVSRGTVRQALERLARSGLIVRHQGRGSFVAAPLEYPLGRFYRFAHEMHVRGIPESSRVLARGVVRAPAVVAGVLCLGAKRSCASAGSGWPGSGPCCSRRHISPTTSARRCASPICRSAPSTTSSRPAACTSPG